MKCEKIEYEEYTYLSVLPESKTITLNLELNRMNIYMSRDYKFNSNLHVLSSSTIFLLTLTKIKHILLLKIKCFINNFYIV